METLANTSWLLPDKPYLPPLLEGQASATFLLDIISSSVSFSSLTVALNSGVYSLSYDDTLVYDTAEGWSSNSYKGLTIEGGADVTNQTLLAWFAPAPVPAGLAISFDNLSEYHTRLVDYIDTVVPKIRDYTTNS